MSGKPVIHKGSWLAIDWVGCGSKDHEYLWVLVHFSLYISEFRPGNGSRGQVSDFGLIQGTSILTPRTLRLRDVSDWTLSPGLQVIHHREALLLLNMDGPLCKRLQKKHQDVGAFPHVQDMSVKKNCASFSIGIGHLQVLSASFPRGPNSKIPPTICQVLCGGRAPISSNVHLHIHSTICFAISKKHMCVLLLLFVSAPKRLAPSAY